MEIEMTRASKAIYIFGDDWDEINGPIDYADDLAAPRGIAVGCALMIFFVAGFVAGVSASHWLGW